MTRILTPQQRRFRRRCAQAWFLIVATSFVLVAIALAIALLSPPVKAECGLASWYETGRRTANGEHFNPDGISAAHKTLPFGTRVTVRNQKTGRSILVRINDRGPFVAGRIIDLSRGAKRALGMDGLMRVCLDIVSLGSGRVERQNPGFAQRALSKLRRVAAAPVRAARRVFSHRRTYRRHSARRRHRHRRHRRQTYE